MSGSDPLSFLPEDYLERKVQRRTIVICGILAGIVIAAIGSAFSITERTNREAEQQHNAVVQQYSEAAREIDQVQLIERKQAQMARRAELAASLLEKIPRSNILAEVHNAAPDDVSLTEFTLASTRRTPAAGAPAPDAKKADPQAAPDPIAYDVSIHVTGIAPNNVQVAEFIRRLGESPLLKDVNLVISDESLVKEQKVLHFTVEMSLNDQADVRNLKPRAGHMTADLGSGAKSNASVAVPTN